MRIEDLIHRRSDLGTFLVHLTRDGDEAAPERLRGILQQHTLKAKTPEES